MRMMALSVLVAVASAKHPAHHSSKHLDDDKHLQHADALSRRLDKIHDGKHLQHADALSRRLDKIHEHLRRFAATKKSGALQPASPNAELNPDRLDAQLARLKKARQSHKEARQSHNFHVPHPGVQKKQLGPGVQKKQQDCGIIENAACLAEDGTTHWCISPATDGMTDVFAVKSRESEDIVCKACGSKGEEACLDSVTLADWCISPANVDGSTVQALFDETMGKVMCNSCGETGMDACVDPGDNSVHSCTSPDASGNAITAVNDPPGSWHYKCTTDAGTKSK